MEKKEIFVQYVWINKGIQSVYPVNIFFAVNVLIKWINAQFVEKLLWSEIKYNFKYNYLLINIRIKLETY